MMGSILGLVKTPRIFHHGDNHMHILVALSRIRQIRPLTYSSVLLRCSERPLRRRFPMTDDSLRPGKVLPKALSSLIILALVLRSKISLRVSVPRYHTVTL